LFSTCIIHILYTECAKIKKNNSGAKRLSNKVTISNCLAHGFFPTVDRNYVTAVRPFCR